MADGTLADTELAVLRALATKLGLAKHDLKQIIAQGRSRQYAAARTRCGRRNAQKVNKCAWKMINNKHAIINAK